MGQLWDSMALKISYKRRGPIARAPLAGRMWSVSLERSPETVGLDQLVLLFLLRCQLYRLVGQLAPAVYALLVCHALA